MSGSAAMRTFGMCLWKEWRDHRAVLLGMVLLVPLLLAVLALALPRKMFDHPGFADNTAVACLAILVISLTTDLVPGEARRGHRWFLERLPGGLRAPFLAKLVLFVAGGTLFTAFGYAAGADACYLVTGAVPYPFSPGTTTWVLAVAALWTFAVSCFLPRGALSLPAVAALALILSLPVLLCSQAASIAAPESWWRWESAALWSAGGVVAAWTAFRRGRLVRAGRACLAVGAVCALPYWADAAVDVYRWNFDPEPCLSGGCLGEGGRYAFLARTRTASGRRAQGLLRELPPVIVDLRSGAAREASPSGESHCFYGVSGGSPHRYVRLGTDVFDTRSAEIVHPAEGEWRSALRVSTPWRLPDGRRFWRFGSRLEAETADGGVEVLVERWREWDRTCGRGFEDVDFCDPTRRRIYKRAELGLRGYTRLWIRAGRWLARNKRGFDLLDPDANVFSPAAGLRPGDEVGSVLDDDRVLVLRGSTALLVDPETGATRVLSVPAGLHLSIYDEGRAPDGRLLLHLYESGRTAWARLDGATDALAVTASVDGYARLLGCPTDDEVIVHDDGAIYRLRFGSDEREEIWKAR